ncbi:hypothetical protein [Lacinutrix chionoecetis]
MQLKKYLRIKLPAFAAILLSFGLTSCGSYQYVGQDSDGVYGDDDRQVEVIQTETDDAGNDNYYKNYFKEKSLEMEAADANEVFVDIDAYEGSYAEDGTQQSNTGYGSWGENGNEVSINVYNNGFGYYNYWNQPFYGWNRWGWNRPYAGWNIGFGYGYGYGGFGWNAGFYDPFWGHPFYGYGYGYGYGGYPYYGGFYGRNHRGLAYNSTRRGSVYGRNSVLGRRVEASRRSNTATRTRTSSTPRVRSTNTPRVRTNTPRVRTNSSTPRVRTNTPRTRTNSSTPRNPAPRVRSNTPRSSAPRATSPSRSSRSSGSTRSSGGSRRRG